jgi:ankyrin repeat domain-containing protein 50
LASADPGCGKSVLAKSLIDQEMKATESRITCYFFFKDDNETQKSITIALSALLHQLFSQKRSLIQHAMADYEVEGNQLPQSFHKLWSILTKATSDSRAGEVVCILDALDECEESGRYEIIDALNTFYKQATSSKRSASQLKFLVTSRPYFDIERRFTDLTRTFPTIRLQGEKESEAISCEINIVIKWRVSDLRQELELDDSEQSTLENELLNMTHRTYLWLKLIFEVICDEIGLTKKKLKQIIGTLPITVDQAYEAILSKIRDKDSKRTQKLLNIIVVAKRPLTLKEMNIALAIEDHHRSYEDLDLENEARFESTVRNVCGLFVSIIDQKVYLIHQTAKEFLIAKSEVLLGGWKHSLDPMESELLMARICITYLMFTVFDDHLFGEATSSAIDKQTQNHGYLSYAASFWAFHHRQAQRGATKELLQSVVDICKTQGPRFQNWFYVYWNTLLFSSHLGFTSSLLVASYFGHEIVVKLLLETGEADVDSKNKAGRTPLCYAAENGHEAVVKLLLKTGKADVDSKDEASRTPLSYAAKNGHEAVVKLLLKTSKVDVDLKDEASRTPLSYAAKNGHEAVVKLLLKTGKAEVNSKDWFGRTSLCYAAKNGHEAIVKLLLKTGKADVDSKDNDSQTPLSWAAESGHDAVVNLVLVTGKAEVDSKNNRGQTPLLCAAGKGHDAVVKLLLETGEVEVNAKAESGRGPFEHYGQTPLSLAAEYGYEAVVKLLLETGKAEVNSRDDIGVRVGLTFAIGGREFKRDRYGQTPLSLAAEYGHEAVVKLLLETAEAEVDSKDDTFGRTPLLWAAAYGHEAVVKLLLETGKAEVDSKDDIHGRAPLSWAAEYGHEAVVKLLLATGEAKVDLRDNYGQTSLYMAAGKGHDAVVKLLLATGKAEVNSKNDEGQMPLLYAAGIGHKAVVKLLLETGKAEVDSKDDTLGRTPLSWAAERGHEAIVKLLLDTGEAEADSKDNDGQTPLLLAAEYGQDAVAKLLLETGEVEADSKDNCGQTPMSLAAKYGHKAVVKLLLETGRVKIDSKDNFGRTPLFYAAENSHDPVVKLLQPISSS